MKTKLSIIIVSFNTKELLDDCLSSLFKNYNSQLKLHEYEVIVVDNASSDDTIGMIKGAYSFTKIIESKTNDGFAKANNIGIKKSRGDYILLLNPDTQIPQKTLSRVLSYMENDTAVGVTSCKVVLPNGEIDDASHRGFPTPWRAFTYFSGLGKIFPSSPLFNGYHLAYKNLDKVHEVDAVAGAFLMMSRKAGALVNFLDEDYFWYGDDLDLCFRIKEKGFKVMYIPDVSIMHYKGASSGIKRHSQHLSKADSEVKKNATKARFEVMRIFYRKHYLKVYPSWLTSLVLFGISVKQKITEYTV